MIHLSQEDKRVWALIIFVAVIGVLFIPFSQTFWGVNYDYTLRNVAAGGAILGIVSGALGCFAVLRQESLMGDSLSHAALPGVAVAFLVAGRDLSVLLIGAGVAGWLGMLLISSIVHTTRIKQDTAMGVTLATFFAIGLALLTYIQGRPDASQAGLDRFIFGQAAAIVRSDVELITGVGLVEFAILFLFWKEFKLITFDYEFARANGYPVRFYDTLLSTLIVVAIVLGLQLAGVILMVGMLIAPAVAARQWTHKMDQMIFLAAVFGAFAGSTGAVISAVDTDMPTGPLIIVVAFMLVFISISLAPGRGLAWALWRRRQDRLRFAAQNVLRDLYRHALGHGDPYFYTEESLLVNLRGSAARIGLHRLEQEGKVIRRNGEWALTESGAKIAARDARNQQLWDVYRQYSDALNLAVIPEDRQHDIAETLQPDAIQRLEQILEGGAD